MPFLYDLLNSWIGEGYVIKNQSIGSVTRQKRGLVTPVGAEWCV